MLSIFRRKLRKNILILCALPFDKNRCEDLYNRNQSDFLESVSNSSSIGSFESLWELYKPTALELRKLLTAYKAAGATIKTECRCDDLRRIQPYDAVILIAHHICGSDAIELFDGPVKTSEIVNAVPRDYSGVIDISSCYSSSFQLEIKMNAPSCHIIATETETSLHVRVTIYQWMLDRLKYYDDDYVQAFRTVINNLVNNASKEKYQGPASAPAIHLGGEQKSTIYAPKEAKTGETFIVQLYLHRESDCEDIEIQARMVDESAEKLNSKFLSMKLKKGDKVDISLQSRNEVKTDFIIPISRQSIIWQNMPVSAEFTVSVVKQCVQSAFVGAVMLSVNKIPVGTMLFKTIITDRSIIINQDCALFESKPYDKKAEMLEATVSIRNKILDYLETISSNDSDDKATQKERELCERCLCLLSEKVEHKKNTIPRIFISSTSDMTIYRKLIEERVKACEMFPDMYELWGQANEYPRDVCCEHVLKSDGFICLLGPKYGYIEPIWDKSMTEIEFRIALCAGKPMLIYILTDEHDTDERQRLFQDEIKTIRTVGMFKDQLTLALVASSEINTLKNQIQ